MLQLAAVVIERAPVLIEWPQLDASGRAGNDKDLVGCWTASQERLKAWSRHVVAAESPGICVPRDVTRLLIDLFVSEPLSRIWAAVVICEQHQRGLKALPSVLRVVLDHEETLRQRAAGIVSAGRSLPLEQSLQLHRLRRTTQRASQLLVESMAMRYDAAREFCRPPSLAVPRAQPRKHWWLIAARAATPLRLLAQSLTCHPMASTLACSEESQAVAENVLRCLPAATLPGNDAPVNATQLSLYADNECAAAPYPWSPQGDRLPNSSLNVSMRRHDRQR